MSRVDLTAPVLAAMRLDEVCLLSSTVKTTDPSLRDALEEYIRRAPDHPDELELAREVLTRAGGRVRAARDHQPPEEA